MDSNPAPRRFRRAPDDHMVRLNATAQLFSSVEGLVWFLRLVLPLAIHLPSMVIFALLVLWFGGAVSPVSVGVVALMLVSHYLLVLLWELILSGWRWVPGLERLDMSSIYSRRELDAPGFRHLWMLRLIEFALWPLLGVAFVATGLHVVLGALGYVSSLPMLCFYMGLSLLPWIVFQFWDDAQGVDDLQAVE